ncbi:hypothetical protein [Ruania albidiflava]|uniref:hypothetical protein n=1 Tax=Ruania albidiflava TaxID=366586 RepID=UPI0023EF6670|nr:hypothetical protein [Ruania albidiflava]
MSGTDLSEDSRAGATVRDLYAGWRYAAIGVLGAAMLVLGLVGHYQTVPGIGFTDALYGTIRLFVFEYDVDDDPSLALDIARFGAGAVVYLAVAIAALGILERQFTLARAARLRGHVVVIGNGAEAVPIAMSFRSSGLVPRSLVINDDDAVVTRRRSGVVQLPSVSDESLRRVVDHAAQVFVVGATDEETAQLAHRLRGLPVASDFPTTVLLTDRNLVGHWASAAPEAVVCRPAQTAISALRIAPPFADDAMVPPPVVVGEGAQAAELARWIVTGWQQPGERLRVYCLGTDQRWVDEAAAGIEERADLVWVPMEPNVALAPRTIRELAGRSPGPDERFAQGKRRVYVAYPHTSRTVPIAAAIARRVSEVDVTAVVDDADAWSGTLGEKSTLRMVSALQLLSDPTTLRLSATDLLAGELVADASRWPADVPGVFGSVLRDADRKAVLDAQPAAVRAAVRAVAENIADIFTAAGVELDAGFPAEVPTLVLSPGELTQIEAVLARLLPAADQEMRDPGRGGSALRRPADELRLRRLELAARLPVLAARAGLVPVRRGGGDAPLTDAAVREMALEVHHDYLRTATTTQNATQSPTARLGWDELAETDQRSSIAQVVDIPVKLAALGLTWRPAEEPQLYEFTDAEVELLAELEHRRWVHFQLRNGRARHTFNTSWQALSAGVQEYDRGPVRLLARLLASLGYEVTDQH